MVDVIGWFKKEVPMVEQDVLNFIKAIELDFKIAIGDAEKALQWVANQTPNIAKDLQVVTNFIGAVPVVAGNPEVAAAVTAANIAVQGLNAFAGAFNQATTGGGVPLSSATQAVIQGYQAVKSAQAAAASVAQTAVAATTTAKSS